MRGSPAITVYRRRSCRFSSRLFFRRGRRRIGVRDPRGPDAPRPWGRKIGRRERVSLAGWPAAGWNRFGRDTQLPGRHSV
jgi:hypothetical protein